jgi:hypothetical protein
MQNSEGQVVDGRSEGTITDLASRRETALAMIQDESYEPSWMLGRRDGSY